LTVLIALTCIINYPITVKHIAEDGSLLYTIKLEPATNLVAQVHSNEFFSNNPIYANFAKWVTTQRSTLNITVSCVHMPDGEYQYYPS